MLDLHSFPTRRSSDLWRVGRWPDFKPIIVDSMEQLEVPKPPRVNYLNAEYGVKSWLLTKDHKRIALLYLGAVSFFFFIRSEEHTSELQSHHDLVCRLL